MRIGSALIFVLVSGIGCSSRGDATTAGQKLGPCVTPENEVTTVYTGQVGGFVAVGGDIVVESQGLVRVALSTGESTSISMVDDPYDLVALGDTLYFTASQPAGPPDPQGKQSSESVFQSIAIDGVTPQTIPGVTPGGLARTVDEDSLYFDAVAAKTAVLKLTPPSTKPVELGLGMSILINAIAVQHGQVYVAGDDLTSKSQTENGVIVRVAKSGGGATQLVSGIGHPFNLIADDSGLYWIEDPPDFGSAHIVHAGLDGSARRNLLETNATSLVLSNGRLYFTATDVQSIPIAGGPVTTLASGLKGPGMLQLASSNLVWLDPESQALSDPTPPNVMTTCIPRTED